MSQQTYLNNMAINPTGLNFSGQPQPQYFNQNNFAPRYEVIQVNGEGGVDAFQMGPNSSVLLLDKTAPIVWLVQSDGAGYKVKTPYDISPHQAVPPADINSLEQRLSKLEEIVNARYQSDDKPVKSKKSKPNVQQSTDAVD